MPLDDSPRPPGGPRRWTAPPREIPPPERSADGPALNAAQAAAASHAETPLLIIAGAGTGKTRTLVHRVAHLIDRGIPPERLLLLTFTRRAAQEMVGRAERLVGSRSRQIQGGTFHAAALATLRRFGQAAGLTADFAIMDAGDAADLMGLARADRGLGDRQRRFPKKETLHALYSRHVNTDRPVAELVEHDLPQHLEWIGDIEALFADYVRRKEQGNVVDYDDLLLFWTMLVEHGGPVAEEIIARHHHVLVDEYQDTNALQARLLRALAPHGRITVVGDDAQSIYSFRGATVRNILDFPQTFPGTTVVTLEQNYRSSAPILETTNAVIARATERYSKELWTERVDGERPWLLLVRDEPEQTRTVVERILALHEEGTPLREIAVLVRAGYMSADLEIELQRRQLPFEKWGGLKFLEAAHIKDVLAILRVLENPRDTVSWYRLFTLLPGVGDATARAAIEEIANADWRPAAFGAIRPPARARATHEQVTAVVRDLLVPRAGGLPEDIARIRRWYDPLLAERYDDARARLSDLDQLQTIASSYTDRATFLAALALEPPSATQDFAVGGTTEDDALILSTMHSAKGKEFDAVFVLWGVEGYIPMARSAGDDAQLDEERRLLYVAMTRARHQLHVCCPLQSYATRTGPEYAIDQISRFLDRGVLSTMQKVVRAPEVPTGDDGRAVAVPATATIDLRAALRARFGGAS
jgi:DNA helicase-2/ATP-dependent DNA helicase PcrA